MWDEELDKAGRYDQHFRNKYLGLCQLEEWVAFRLNFVLAALGFMFLQHLSS